VTMPPHPPAPRGTDPGGSPARRLVAEFRRRKVPQTLVLYMVGAWLALQVADLAFPGLGIPESAIRYVWIGAAALLPLVLLFGWRYQVTQGGIVRTAYARQEGDDRSDGAVDGTTLPLRRSDHALLAAMVLVAVGIVWPLTGALSRSRAMPVPGGNGPALAPTSVAVLPLQNVTGDPDQEFLAAGLHDALVTTLSTVSALTVKAASSTNVYRNVVQPIRQTGLELAAGHLIEGSVFRAANRIRVNVRLIDASTEENVWSESYERPMEDVLALQNEVARAVAREVEVELAPDEEERLTTARKVDPEVYETYLRGMYHLNQYTPEGVQRGMEYLHQAVAMDPADPLAYAGLAQGYTLIGHGANPPEGVFDLARDAAARSLELDPLFPQANAAMAEIRLYSDWDWAAAEQAFRRTLQLSPNLEWAHGHFAWHQHLMGNVDAAIGHMRRAQQIAPLTPIFSAWLGWLYWGDGQHERAEAEARKALELNPTFPWGLYVLGGTLADQGLHEEALATYERLYEVQPNVGLWGFGYLYALLGREADANRVLEELAEQPGQKDVLNIGLIHAALGHDDEAIAWLERAYEMRVDWFPWVASLVDGDGLMRSARETLVDDPRFRSLVAQLALPGRTQ
jgi:TolB-like protein/Flp pilus assembly protein TadD